MTADSSQLTERKTGRVWSYRRESEQMFHGDYDTRHEAIGHATIVGRILDEKTYVRSHESIWTKVDDPVVCGYCGHEEYYRPLVSWTFAIGVDESPFCTTQCYARHMWEDDKEELIP